MLRPMAVLLMAADLVAPVIEYLKRQGRFAHFAPEDVEHFQTTVDKMWTEWLIPGVIPFTVPQKDLAILNIDKRARVDAAVS